VTLTEALAKLHEAGRIRSPWLPGMHTAPEGWRVLYLDRDTGVAVTYRDGTDGGLLMVHPSRVASAHIDLTDPATVGCLLALLREASGDPEAVVGLDSEEGKRGNWWTNSSNEWARDHDGATEGDAIAAALIALAEAL
jgi:hypothetical protein